MNSYSVYFVDYTIGTDAYEKVPKICRSVGKRVFLIGGAKALQAARGVLEEAIAEVIWKSWIRCFLEKSVPMPGLRTWRNVRFNVKADMIFGMGGGKALDTAKGAAYKAELPVFTFPTIAATCAAATALSVVYKEDGNFDSFYFYDRPARHCFIQLPVIADAPAKYLRAGMGDTIGKYFECHFAARGDQLAHSSALGREISNLCYRPLLVHGVQALNDCMEERQRMSWSRQF